MKKFMISFTIFVLLLGVGGASWYFGIFPPKPTWTIMIYLDGDNDLEKYAMNEFFEMSQVGSDDHLNILVQLDRIPGEDVTYNDWPGTRRFVLQQGDKPDVAPLMDLEEVNMGDPTTLQDFIEWGVTNYPADHYLLSLWNHGGGWRTQLKQDALQSQDNTEFIENSRAICWDTSSRDKLYMDEVQYALAQAQQTTGEKLDVIGFDACLLGMLEVAYEIQPYADYMVASEHTVLAGGWPYNYILGQLARRSVSPQQLAKTIVNGYVDVHPNRPRIAQSAIDLAEIPAVTSALDDFIQSADTDWAALAEARESSQTYRMDEFPRIFWGMDMVDFADTVANSTTDPALQEAAQTLVRSVNDAVIAEGHSPDLEGSHGLAIYFPATSTDFYNDPHHTGYEQDNQFMPVDLVQEHGWDEWLIQYYQHTE